MQAVGRKAQSPLSSISNTNGGSAGNAGSCRLSFYESPPSVDVDIESFESYGIARLQVLRRIDVLQQRGVKGDAFDREINKADLDQLFDGNGNGSSTVGSGNNKDHVSHYILRMAYCRTDELRKWFLANECALFKIRFETAMPSDVDAFLRDHEMLLKYPPISHAEKMRLKPKLMGLHHGGTPSDQNYAAADYYRVPFADVLQLVSRREAYLEGGHAYVSRSRVFSLAEGKFRASLSKSLARAHQTYEGRSSDARLGPIVTRLGRAAFRYGGSVGGAASDGAADVSRAVTETFVQYLTTVMGHSDPKTKTAGVSKMYVSVGTRRPTERDKMCPIANRVHKNNTQKYTIYFDTLVMQQGCWDGDCQAKNKNVYYQIREDGRVVKVGWTPPELDTTMIANTVSCLCGGGSSSTCTPCDDAATTPASKKMKLSSTSAGIQVSQ